MGPPLRAKKPRAARAGGRKNRARGRSTKKSCDSSASSSPDASSEVDLQKQAIETLREEMKRGGAAGVRAAKEILKLQRETKDQLGPAPDVTFEILWADLAMINVEASEPKPAKASK